MRSARHTPNALTPKFVTRAVVSPSMRNVLRLLAVILLIWLALPAFTQAQSWQPGTNEPPVPVGNPLLLTDGTVIAQEWNSSGYPSGNWYRLTPDINGSYVNGTWSQIASMPAGYAPYAYGSAVLPDGRVVVVGGEYNGQSPHEVWVNLAAIYDPVKNTWTPLTVPASWTNIGDAQTVVLPNGTMLVANPFNTQIAQFNPGTLNFTVLATTGKADRNDEEGWTLLPDGSVLTVDVLAAPGSQRFLPATGQWVSAGNTPVGLIDGSQEVGPAVLRPDGTVFASGATGNTAIYSTTTGTWTTGPTFPVIAGTQFAPADAPAALLPDGNVLIAASPLLSYAPNGQLTVPVHMFEFDGTQLNQAPDFEDWAGNSDESLRLLLLPNGQVMLTFNFFRVEIYTPAGTANPNWAPIITAAPAQVAAGQTYTITGNQFNGLSQAVAYGDDYQAATNYPLVRITNQQTGHVFYARTHGHSSMGVATGNTPVSTNFDVPSIIEPGSSNIQVVANGIASAPWPVSVSVVNFASATPTLDTVTSGNWIGKYGADGYSLAVAGQNLPSYDPSFGEQGGSTYTWATAPPDARALLLPSGSARIAATWYSGQSFSFDVNVTDGNTHQLALYAVDWDRQGRAETIQISDAGTGQVLSSRAISSFANGVYVVWEIAGHVTVTVTANSGPNAVISGVFFAGAGQTPPVFTSANTTTFTAGTSGTFMVTTSASPTASLSETGTLPTGVSFVDNGNGTATLSGTPTLGSNSTYGVTLSATNTVTTTLQSFQLLVNAPATGGTGASFVRADTSTQGNWMGTYGADGEQIAAESSSPPNDLLSYGSYSVPTSPTYIYPPNNGDPRDLETDAQGDRIASVWYSGSSLSFDVNFSDTNSHQVALYVMDWDAGGRNETIQITDANSAAVLDTRTIPDATSGSPTYTNTTSANFVNGTYLIWNISGHVRITVTRNTGVNAVVAGIFFGGAPLIAPVFTSANNTSFTIGQFGNFTVSTTGTPTPSLTEIGQLPTGVNFVDNGNGTATLSGTPAAGSTSLYNLDFTASNSQAAVTQSFALTINPAGVITGPTAAFVSADKSTQGNWPGVYDGDGYDIAGGPQSPPGGTLSYGQYSVQNELNWTWAANTTDPRGLETDAGGDRTAATWYNASTFRFDVNFTDGNTHRVALYLVDWDHGNRSETVQVLDQNNPNNILDTRTVPGPNTGTGSADFPNGVYLVWNISGHVIIQVTDNSGPNAVVSGIFFGPAGTVTLPPPASATWLRSDTSTQGTWLGKYGTQGYSLAWPQQMLPPLDTFGTPNAWTWTWAINTTDPRALEMDSYGDRSALAWYLATPFQFDLNLGDGQAHQIALYVVDWDNGKRSETITISSASTGAVLDSRSIPNANAASGTYTNTTSDNFSNGTYLIWNVTGHVTITVTPNVAPNGVVSGMFLDPASP